MKRFSISSVFGLCLVLGLMVLMPVAGWCAETEASASQQGKTEVVPVASKTGTATVKSASPEAPGKMKTPAMVEPKAIASQALLVPGGNNGSDGGPLPEGVLIHPENPAINSQGPDRDARLEWDPNDPVNTRGSLPMDPLIQQSKRILRETLNELLRDVPDTGITQDGLAPGTPESALIPGSGLRGAPGAGAYGFKGYPVSATFGGPPDVDLAVGNTYVIGDYNSYFHIYNKAGVSQGTITMQSLFTGLGVCGNGNTCDPQVVYDDENDRYVAVGLGLASSTDSRICVAVSKAETPLTLASNWWTYEIDPAGTGIADYPKLSVQQDALFIGAVWFPSTGGNNSVGWMINKTKTYAGTALTTGDVAQYTFAGSIMPQGAERRGFEQGQYPPVGSPTYIITPNSSTGAHDLWRWNLPSLTSTPAIWQASVTSYPGSITQPNNTAYTTQPIDALDIRMMDAELRWPYLWTCRTGNDGANFDTIQWNQINVSGGAPSVVQTSEYAIGSNHLWMADLTVDTKQNFVTVFNRASATGPVYVGGYLAGRQAGDTANALTGPVTVKAGEKQLANGADSGYGYWRWGDYNGAAIDPNGCDIWVNLEYVRNRTTTPPTTGVEDTSWIANYRFADCAVTPSAFLNKLDYFCVDDVSATITDTTGTPTQAVYHTEHGTVNATISGTGPSFTVSPTTITALNGVNGDHVWISFRAGNGTTYNSNNSNVDCARQVCVYAIDELTGGCDADKYHDVGEVLNYNIAFANYEAVDLPGPFEATLTCTDPDVEILNPTVTFPALPINTYAYSDYPVGVRYNGTFPANCIKTLTFNITNIHAIDNAWTNAGGGCSASQTFTEIANADFQAGSALWSESFDLTTFPPTGWAQLDVLGTALNWARSTGTVHPAGFLPHSGAGLAYANSWTPQPPAAVRLYRNTVSNLSTYSGAVFSYWFFHDNQYTNEDTIQIQVCEAGTATCATNGTHWVNVGAPVYRFNGSANIWEQHTVDLSSYTGAGHTSVQVGILADGQYGNDMHIDDAALTPGTAACETSTCSPAPVLAYSQFAFDDPDCNNDGSIDPGDVGNPIPYLANTGNDWAYGTTGTLSCPTCDAVFGAGMIDICDNQAEFSDIPYGTAYVYGPGTINPFVVAVDPTVACPGSGSQIPFQVTVQSTNPYGPVTLDAPMNIGIENVVNPDPLSGMSYYDLFITDAGTAGASGRWGFTNAWTETLSWTASTTAADGCWVDADSSSAYYAGGKNVIARLTHTFSTVGMYTDVAMWWEWDVGLAGTGDIYDLGWSPGGATWCDLGLNDPGTGAGTNEWQCWSGSLYATVAAGADTPPCSGPAAAATMLNNPNFAIRFTFDTDASAAPARIGAMWIAGTAYQCASTPCTGVCPSVGAPPPPTPNGDDIAGTPFRLTKGTGANTVHATWGTNCGTPDTFNIYWGDLSTLGTTKTVTHQNCAIGITGDVDNLASPTPSAGQGYWAVITAVEGTSFGRHGDDSSGSERVLGGDAAACGGTKDITDTTCALRAGFDPSSAGYSSVQPKYADLMRKPLSRCNPLVEPSDGPTLRVPKSE